jgi:cytochrome c551/c552
VWNGLNEEIRVLPKLIQENTSLESLARLTEGGPARWPDHIVTKGEKGPLQGPFSVDRISWPEPNPWNSWIRFGGFDFFRDSSRAALSTWSGDVWLLSGIDEGLEELDWQRIATGLYQPLGLKIVDEDIYVLARDQITILRDLNEDGEADYYENFNNDLQNTEHFHEFAMDLQTDSRGDFYFMKGGRHGKDALIPQHGTLLKVAEDGSTLDIIANGFRAPNGLLIRPDGKFVSTDQQGHWIPANRINILEPGGFYGYMWSFHQNVRPTEYSDPLLWIHPVIDRSPSTLVWTASPSWPQIKERMLSLSYGMGKIDLVMTEEVDGKMQGALTRLPLDFETGIMRGQFHPVDGHLYVAGMFGWAGNKISSGGFYRIRRTREPLHLPVSFQTVKDGIFITFTNELDPLSVTDSGNFHVQEWNYEWKERYGSPDFKLNGEEGRDEVIVEWSALSPDRKTVFLKLENLRPAMQIHTEFSLRAGDGASVRNFLHGSIFNLGNRSSEEIVTPRWHRKVTADKPVLEQLGLGLMQEIRPLPQKQDSETSRLRSVSLEADYRITRMAALHVPQGTDPSPFVSAGGFSSSWRGYLRSPLNTKVQFSFEGNGTVKMFVNGEVVVSSAQGLINGLKSKPLDLIGGLNRIEIFYQSPHSGDATFRLFWSSDEWLSESVPPHLFLHEKNDPRLLQSDLNRKGRDLFAQHKCLNCHRPKNPRIKFPEESMPELDMMAPRLDEIGVKRRSGWLANWIEKPSQVRSDARMPALLKGPASTQQAADIASFLVGMSKPYQNHKPPWLQRPEIIGRGETLVKTLGCLACHSIGDGAAPGKDTLDGVANGWYPNGLADYLENPQEHEEWSEMPDFSLSPSESKAITAYLFSFGQNVIDEAPGGNSRRGGELVKELGCANCHRLSGFEAEAVEPPFEKIRRRAWSTGCLAGSPDLRGNAPDLNLSPSERSTVVSFVQNSTDSLRRRNWAEFATRQSRRLRCWSCHGMDKEGPTWLPQVPESISKEIVTIHNKIPDLSWAGEKLQQPWMERLIRGALPYKTRPRLTARMPSFPAFSKGLSIGLLQQHGISKLKSEEKAHDTNLARLGKGLTGAQQLGCVQCHPVGGSAALAGPDTETIDLQYVGDRLRQKFFQRILRNPSRVIPGTMMPSFMDAKGRSTLQPILGGNGDEQGRAIWEYIQSLN